MDAKFQPMRLLDLRIRDHVTISAGTLGFSTESEPDHRTKYQDVLLNILISIKTATFFECYLFPGMVIIGSVSGCI